MPAPTSAFVTSVCKSGFPRPSSSGCKSPSKDANEQSDAVAYSSRPRSMYGSGHEPPQRNEGAGRPCSIAQMRAQHARQGLDSSRRAVPPGKASPRMIGWFGDCSRLRRPGSERPRTSPVLRLASNDERSKIDERARASRRKTSGRTRDGAETPGSANVVQGPTWVFVAMTGKDSLGTSLQRLLKGADTDLGSPVGDAAWNELVRSIEAIRRAG